MTSQVVPQMNDGSRKRSRLEAPAARGVEEGGAGMGRGT